MFSTLVQKLMISFLGEYIDGIRNSMDVALLKGRIRIENVSLRREFFDNLSLPIRLGFSRIESIDVHIPWTNLKEKPTTVQIDGIYALFYVNYELSQYKFDVEARFQEMIDKATDMIKMKFEQKKRDSDSTVEKYILRIVDNLKVKVKNIHIRLQSVERGWDFALGLLINRVSLNTVNEIGEKHFFVRAKHHHHHHLHRKSKSGQDILYKKVQVQNIDLYFNQNEKDFITLIQDKEASLIRMKSFLIDLQFQATTKMISNPKIVMSLKMEVMIRAKLNEHSKYDIDVKALTCPLQLNLTDRMTAEIFYFLQFAFEWKMQKYKKPNKDACMSAEMINFYKLVLANVLQDIPLHKQDYKTVLRLISEWTYDFLNQTTLEFIQDQKLRREMARRKNSKLMEDPVRFEQFKREIEDQILTEEERKQIFDIIGRVSVDLNVPSIKLVLSKTQEARQMFGLRGPVIFMIGFNNISLSFSTHLEKDATFTLEIQDLVIQQDQRHMVSQIPTSKPSLQSFITLIYTRSKHDHEQSCSIKLSKRVISLNQRFLSCILEWLGTIRLRPATVHFLKQIVVHYFTQIVKKYLLKLFKEFRVINLNIGLPVLALTVGDQKKTIVVDCGRLEGKSLTHEVYRLQLVEQAKVMIDQSVIVAMEQGAVMEVVDKLKIVSDQKVLELTDRQRIIIQVRSLRIDSIDKLIDLCSDLLRSPIIEEFLHLNIIQDQLIFLQGRFYLNNNPHRQRILLRTNSLHFLPSRYSIDLKRCKIYQMPLQSKNYLVLHSLVSNRTDVIEVESPKVMETIFYKIREMIHLNATGAEWDAYYKVDYPVMIDQLQVLKSQAGENLPLFSFEVEVDRIFMPLGQYLKSYPRDKASSMRIPPSNVLNFLQTNDTSYLETNVSKLQLNKIYMRIGFYQLTTDFFSEVRDIKLVIDDEDIFKNFSFALSCLESEYVLANFSLHQFQVEFKSQQVLKKILSIGMLFEDHIETFLRTVQETDLYGRIEKISQQRQELSVLEQTHSFTENSHEAWFEERRPIHVPSQTLLSVRVMFSMKSLKLNFLNYRTDVKLLEGDVEMYRGDYMPFFKVTIGQAIFLSSVQLTNLSLCMDNRPKQNLSYLCELKADKITVFEHVEFIILALLEGELGSSVLDVIGMFEERKKSQKQKFFQPFLSKTEQKPHIKFQSFVSPIKKIPQELYQAKHLQLSMKSLAESLLEEKETCMFAFNAYIKRFEVHVTLKDRLDVIHMVVAEISLQENQLTIGHMKMHQGDREILKCNQIQVKLPRRQKPQEFNAEHDVSIEMKFADFDSPIKNYKKQPLLAEKFADIYQQISPSSVTQILVDGFKVNVDMRIISEALKQINRISETVQKSTRYKLLKKKIQELSLTVLQKREKLKRIIEKGSEKLQHFTQDIKGLNMLPYDLSWIIDTKQITASFRVQTLTPITLEMYSTEGKELLNIELSTKIDYPYYVNSFISFKVNHFNRLVQIYEPVVERTSIKLQKIDRKTEFRALLFDIKAVISEQLVLDLCNDLKVIKDEVGKTFQNQDLLMVENLEFMKIELYERWFGAKSLINETLWDLQYKKSHLIQREFDVFSQEKHKLEDLSRRGVFSKLKVRNYTQCQVLCELAQESFPRQQIHVISEYELNSAQQNQCPRGYFMIPYHKTIKKYTKPSEFLDREFPLSFKLCFISQNYAFHSIGFEGKVSQISLRGQKREYFELVYEDLEGQQRETMIEVLMRFDYFESGIVLEIRPQVEVVNSTVLELGLGCRPQISAKLVQPQSSFQIQKGQSIYLPLWVDQQVSVCLKNYPSRQSSSCKTIPIKSQYSLAQNYPSENFILVKEQFVHYFEAKLGSEYCWIPLLFLRVKKFQKVINQTDKHINFREIKCKIIIMPLVKVENHCGRQLYINGKQFYTKKVNLDKQAQVQQAVYFFLHHQYKKSLDSILFAFQEQGLSYHITLPQNLYTTKTLKLPSEIQTVAPIVLNLLTVNNQFGQMIFHFYPIVEVLLQLPFEQIDPQVSCKYGQTEKQKVCQGLNVHKNTIKTENSPTSCGQSTVYMLNEDSRRLKFSLQCERDMQKEQNKRLFTQKLPDKRSLGYIDVLRADFSTSESESSSSSSSSESISVSDYSEEDEKVQTRVIYVPTTTKLGEMHFAKYQIKRIKKRFVLEEDLATIYTPNNIKEIRHGLSSSQKYESFYVLEMRCVPETPLDNKLIEKKLVKEVTQTSKVKEISKKVRAKLASKSLVLLIKSLNLSLVVRKTLSHETYLNNLKSHHISNQLGQRFELVNLSIADYEMNVSLALNENFKWNEVQLEQRIGHFMVNSLNLQKNFRKPILKLHQNKLVSIITGFSIRQPQILSTPSTQIEKELKDQQFIPVSFLAPSLKFSKLLLEIPDKKPQTQQTYHFDIKITDIFIIECMNWLIKMYPIISSVVSTDENQSLITMILQSQGLSDALKKFQGLISCEEIKTRLSFISLGTKSAQHSTNKKVKKQLQNQKIEDFFGQILQINELNLSKVENLAMKQSRTMQKIFKYIKKIPFNILQIDNASIVIPEIGINGRISDDSATQFERDLLINGATGVLKGMKILGSTGSLMDYIKKKNFKKRQKITGLFDRLAKGSVKSLTGVLKAFSNGISELTFDEAYIEQREDTIAQSRGEEKKSSSSQGFQSFFLGIKSGFTGLVEHPVQNYQQQGAQGFIKGSLKGLTGMFTKPLTGILDLGTKTLQDMRGEKKKQIIQQSSFPNGFQKIFCRPMFHECLLIRKYNQTQYLAYVVLRSVLKRQDNLGLISAFMLKQNPFNQDQKESENIDPEKQVLPVNEDIPVSQKNLLAIGSEKTYMIQLGLRDGIRILQKVMPHSNVKMVGRSENGVCLVLRQNAQINQEQNAKKTIPNEAQEIFINPVNAVEKEEIYRLYKKLAQK